MHIKKGNKKYWFSHGKKCLGYECFAPGGYQHRSTTLSGSRNTGGITLCCLNNAYHGCPMNPVFEKELEKKRKKEGWRQV